MPEQISDNKRIAKNTVMLYIRMLLSMVVSLYTSRVVLDVLGVEDYGIYGLVGGVVAMFSFLNSSMSGATSRFLTYEMGLGNDQRLKQTFSTALIIHVCIALVVFVLSETIGLWFLCNKLVIPEDRIFAAHWVYQCSVISAMLTITQVPYNSLIIAHERMSVYAYIEILNVSLKLLIVYLLTIGDFDKLILYAVLVLIVSVIIILIYRIYCICSFNESRFQFVWNKEILRPMLSFTGLDFYGTMCAAARQQGSNFLINNFYGVVANAASSIAITVNGVIEGFTGSIITAFRPRIIKSYAQQSWGEMQSLIDNAIKFSTLLLIVFAIPVFFEISYLIELWLGQVPEYVISFIRLILLINSIGIINGVIKIGIHATGNIKFLSYITGTVYLLTIPVSFIFLKLGYRVECVYVVNLFSNILMLYLNISILKKQVPSINILSIIIVIVRVVIVALPVVLISYFVYRSLDQGFVRLLAIVIIDIVGMVLFSYSIALNRDQRLYVKQYVKKTFNLHI